MTTSFVLTQSAPVNFRDFGGMAVDGGVIRPRVLFRTDDLSIIRAEDAAKLVDDGLKAVIDLRTSNETRITGRGELEAKPVAYHHLPIIGNLGRGAEHARTADYSAAGMGRMYVGMVDRAAPQFVTAMSIIALAPGGVAFHCSAGKDRTGVLAACILLALGASDDDIISDYVRTYDNLLEIRERIQPVVGQLLSRLGMDLDQARKLMHNDEPMDVAMEVMLAGLRAEHGDPLAPLRAAGLDDSLIERLRSRLLA